MPAFRRAAELEEIDQFIAGVLPWQILSGHHRVLAAAQAGLDEVPCWVRELDDDAAYMLLAHLIHQAAKREWHCSRVTGRVPWGGVGAVGK